MEERLRFVARLLDGEAMTEVCRDFGISRKTGYKIFDRYKEHGLEALTDRSRRPVRYANQLPVQIESLIVRLKALREFFSKSLDSSTADASAASGGSRFRVPRAVRKSWAPLHDTPCSEPSPPRHFPYAKLDHEVLCGAAAYTKFVGYHSGRD
jgi:transposase-like protein